MAVSFTASEQAATMERTVERSDRLGMAGDGKGDERILDTIIKAESVLARIHARTAAELAAMSR
jgi:hypothetical protein